MNIIKEYKIHIIIIASLLIAVVLFLILFYNIPHLSYEYSEEYNGYLVKNAYGNVEEYTIPETYNDKRIVGIGTRAFYQHTKLKTVIFENPKYIKKIGRLAFSCCENLESIDTGSAKYIDLSAFSYCTSLNNVKTQAISIGGSAFYKCTSLDTINIENAKYIGSLSLAYTKIENIKLGINATNVGSDAFYKCDELKKIEVPKALEFDKYLKTLEIVIYY